VDQLTEIFRQEGWLGRRSAKRSRSLDTPADVSQSGLGQQNPMGEVCHG
jgi:hypothetical protein